MIYILESVNPVWKKDTPNKAGRNIGVIMPGQLVYSGKIQKDGWMKIDNGWVYSLDSDGKSKFSSNIRHVSKSSSELDSVPFERRVFYDEDNPDDNPEEGVNYMPESKATWVEGDAKVTVVNNGDGTYTQTRVTKTLQGDQIDEYIVDKDGNTISTTYTSPQKNGYRNVTTIDKDGNTTKITYDKDGENVTTTVTDSSGNEISKTTQSTDPDKQTSNREMSSEEAVQIVTEMLNEGKTYDFGNLSIGNTFGILGAPYQYMETVDRVVDGNTGMGRKYLDKIISKMPLLFIAAGEPQFLAGWSEDDKTRAMEQVIRDAGAKAADLLSGYNPNSPMQNRFYLFKNTWEIYRQYVQPLTFTAATFLGLQNISLPNGIDLDGDWSRYTPLNLHGITNSMNGCVFYIDSETSITDSFSNSAGKSQLEQRVNQFSDLAREVQFLLGSLASNVQIDTSGLMSTGSNGALSNVQNTAEFTQEILGRGNFLEAIAGNIMTVVQGGKLIFPEIWTDSSYNKSYSVTIKLRSPDADKLSWFLNIWVPIAHLLPLVLPKAAGANGYLAPFLVRCWYKGLFFCPMGLITDMSITRGELGNWNLDGLPMSVNITLQIKDLYNTLAVARRSGSLGQYALMENIGMLDYIANFCGCNSQEPDITRTLKFLAGNLINSITNFPHEVGDSMSRSIQNFLFSLTGPRR